MSECSRRVETTGRYERAYARFVGRDKRREQCIEETIETLLKNPHEPHLKTHALKGALAGMLSCRCGYDCRLLFTLREEARTKTELIILLDVGTHDEVY